MDRGSSIAGGVLATAGVGGGGAAIYVNSIETIGYRLKTVENRFLFGEKGDVYLSGAWKDQKSAYLEKYPTGNPDYVSDFSNWELYIPNNLDDVCKVVFGQKFLGVQDETYLFAKRFCSVKETIDESLGTWKSKLSTDNWGEVKQKYQHWWDRDDVFGEFNYLFLDSKWNVDENKVKDFCANKLKDFYVEGSKSLSLFYTVCTKPEKVMNIIGGDVDFLKTSSGEDDSLWNQRIGEYKKTYPESMPTGFFEIPVERSGGQYYLTLAGFKKACENSLNEEILFNTRDRLVSETKKWCTKQGSTL